MGLLREIQKTLIDGGAVANALIKFRYLSSRLGSASLEDWIKFEIEGYPSDALIPDYRIVEVSYSGVFTNGFQIIKEIDIPIKTILDIANENWIQYAVRTSLSEIEHSVSNQGENRYLRVSNTADLAPYLHSKVFKGYNCLKVVGKFPIFSLVGIQAGVRNKLLDMTIDLEKSIPEIAEIEVQQWKLPSEDINTMATQIFHQTIGGNYVHAHISGENNAISIKSIANDIEKLMQMLTENGVPAADAKEISRIISEDGPQSAAEPLSKRAQIWIADRAKDIAEGAWGISLSVATDLIKKAAKSYFELV